MTPTMAGDVTPQLHAALARAFYDAHMVPGFLYVAWEELSDDERDACREAALNFLMATRTAREMRLLGRIRQLEGQIANAAL